ncbi:cysteine proteinase [Sistotremastrum suecicum HHB10207 ss-3]|uniref:Cysteine proteinase n=1 Tax=Sistotremastrum suecicum HHB10207 ss-3 TaxID=1314776 RepID=A0A166J6D3_9AGAM|nr:cysteine proteinase [Sistotremastrum suecicum HHB10207 ss-3]
MNLNYSITNRWSPFVESSRNSRPSSVVLENSDELHSGASDPDKMSSTKKAVPIAVPSNERMRSFPHNPYTKISNDLHEKPGGQSFASGPGRGRGQYQVSETNRNKRRRTGSPSNTANLSHNSGSGSRREHMGMPPQDTGNGPDDQDDIDFISESPVPNKTSQPMDVGMETIGEAFRKTNPSTSTSSRFFSSETTRLAQTEDPSDPIEELDRIETGQSLSEIPSIEPGTVRTRVKEFDERSVGVGPSSLQHIDLIKRTAPRTAGMKDRQGNTTKNLGTKKARKPALTQKPLVFDTIATGSSILRAKDWKQKELLIRDLLIDGTKTAAGVCNRSLSWTTQILRYNEIPDRGNSTFLQVVKLSQVSECLYSLDPVWGPFLHISVKSPVISPGPVEVLNSVTVVFQREHESWSQDRFLSLVAILKNSGLSPSCLKGEKPSGSFFESLTSSAGLTFPFGSQTTEHRDTEEANPRRPGLRQRESGRQPQSTKRPSRAPSIESTIVGPGKRRSREQGRSSPEADQQELILVYPPSGPGALNINRGLLKRLEAGEYLNDTLIEFGLKLWHNNIRAENPDLAEQIHVFSPFFFKKLNQKDYAAAYQSVKRWTAKFDIFEKKYIIVPINENVHWYLAIIYKPHRVLLRPLPPTAAKSPQKPITRSSLPGLLTPDLGESMSHTGSTPPSTLVETALSEANTTLDAATERQVETIVKRTESFSLEDRKADDARHAFNTEMLMPPSDEEMEDIGEPTLKPIEDNEDEKEVQAIINGPIGSPPEDIMADSRITASPELPEPSIEEDFEPAYIFTFDSLGGRHPAVVKALSAYLNNEALERKNVQEPRQAVGKQALVPTQPNFWDCGVYLLHFAETFLSDPTHFKTIIVQRGKGKQTASDRQRIWHDDRVAAIREHLRGQILTLSDAWKASQAAIASERKSAEAQKEGEPIKEPSTEPSRPSTGPDDRIVADSEEEVEIEEVEPPPPAPPPRIPRYAKKPTEFLHLN